MPSKEDIREGIAKAIYTDWAIGSGAWEAISDSEKTPWLKTADKVIEGISRLGVVIKTDRESDAVDDIVIYPTAVYKNEKLIHERTPHEEGWNDGVIETTKRFIEAGYVAVIPLVEDK